MVAPSAEASHRYGHAAGEADAEQATLAPIACTMDASMQHYRPLMSLGVYQLLARHVECPRNFAT